MGAIQKGKSPAVLSMSTPKKRSTDPKIARCSCRHERPPSCEPRARARLRLKYVSGRRPCHDRLLALAARRHVLEPETVGQVKVGLDRRALPRAPDRVLDLDVDLRAVEGAAALVDAEVPALPLQRLCECGRRAAPDCVGAHALLGTRREHHLVPAILGRWSHVGLGRVLAQHRLVLLRGEAPTPRAGSSQTSPEGAAPQSRGCPPPLLVEAELGEYLLGEVENALDLVRQLAGQAEDVRVVLHAARASGAPVGVPRRSVGAAARTCVNPRTRNRPCSVPERSYR